MKTIEQPQQNMTGRPPGWYSDPLSPKVMQRRWNGSHWTTDVHPSPDAPESVRNSTIEYPHEEVRTLEPLLTGSVIVCSDCGGKLSIHAPVCVHCGRPNDPQPSTTTSSSASPQAPPPGMMLSPSPSSATPRPLHSQSVPTSGNRAALVNYPTVRTAAQDAQSTKSLDVPAIVTLVLGSIALILSLVAFSGSGISVMVLAAIAVIATLVAGHKAKKVAEKAGTHRSWMVHVGKLLALAGLILIGFAIAHLVMSVISSGTAALVP